MTTKEEKISSLEKEVSFYKDKIERAMEFFKAPEKGKRYTPKGEAFLSSEDVVVIDHMRDFRSRERGVTVYYVKDDRIYFMTLLDFYSHFESIPYVY